MFEIPTPSSLVFPTATGGQSSLKISLSKNIVTYPKNTQVKLDSNDWYFCVSKSKIVFLQFQLLE